VRIISFVPFPYSIRKKKKKKKKRRKKKKKKKKKNRYSFSGVAKIMKPEQEQSYVDICH
jgi:predicted RNA-binding protein with RPS1 domain